MPVIEPTSKCRPKPVKSCPPHRVDQRPLRVHVSKPRTSKPLLGFANIWWFPKCHIPQCLCDRTSDLSAIPCLPWPPTQNPGDLSTVQLPLQHHGQYPPTAHCPCILHISSFLCLCSWCFPWPLPPGNDHMTKPCSYTGSTK